MHAFFIKNNRTARISISRYPFPCIDAKSGCRTHWLFYSWMLSWKALQMGSVVRKKACAQRIHSVLPGHQTLSAATAGGCAGNGNCGRGNLDVSHATSGKWIHLGGYFVRSC